MKILKRLYTLFIVITCPLVFVPLWIIGGEKATHRYHMYIMDLVNNNE